MYHIKQKFDILVVAMQKFSLATIFIRQVNDFVLISDIKYELNRTSLSYKKITIRFCCFCSTATVLPLGRENICLASQARIIDSTLHPNEVIPRISS